MKRIEIQTLGAAGIDPSRVAEHTGVSVRTVQRVVSEPPISSPAEADAAATGRQGRPSKVAPFLPMIGEWLAEDPPPKSVAILARLRKEGYTGGKSAVYAAVRAARPPTAPKGIVRFEGLPGEFSQHDFGTVWVNYQDGSRERLKFFASRLKYSRLVRVRVTKDETTESVCHSLVDCFRYFGGMPLIAVFDNPKTIAKKRDGEKVEWNETFLSFSLECGFVPKVCWPYRPNEKGSVENLVGFVKRTFFKAHRFRDRQDLEEQLATWHVWANQERTCRATKETPRVRYLLEQSRLKSLQLDPDGYRLKYSRQVRTDGFCEFKSVRYFVGLDHVGAVATLHVGEDDVDAYVGLQCVARLPRNPINGKYSILPEQRGQLLRKRGARSYVKRQLLLDLCPAAEWFLTELVHRRTDQWTEEVDRIYELLEREGEERVRIAFIRAARLRTVGAEYLEAILSGQVAEEVQS